MYQYVAIGIFPVATQIIIAKPEVEISQIAEIFWFLWIPIFRLFDFRDIQFGLILKDDFNSLAED